MPILPAFCDNCGTIFPSGFFIENSSHVILSDNKYGPCPKCKGMGSIPDGIFNFVSGIIEVLSAPQITVERLNRLENLIEELKSDPTEDVIRKVKEEAPELREALKNTPTNNGHITAWLTLVLLAIQTVILGVSSYASKGPSETQIQNMIDTSLENAFKAPPTISPRKRKIGRNDRCSCGSGIKYKKCCLYK